MHYIGMWAFELPGHVTWSMDLVAMSILTASRSEWPLLRSPSVTTIWRHHMDAALLTLAIVSHHFTAMGAVDHSGPSLRRQRILDVAPLAGGGDCLREFGLVSGGSCRCRGEPARDPEPVDTAINNMSQGLCMWDSLARLILWNERYTRCTGCRPNAVRPGTVLRYIIEFRCAAGTFSAVRTDLPNC